MQKEKWFHSSCKWANGEINEKRRFYRAIVLSAIISTAAMYGIYELIKYVMS